MSGFDWKAAIGKVAPTVAGLFGTPAAGLAVAGLCKVLGLEASPENAQIVAEQAAAGTLTGEQLIALRQAEANARAQLAKMGMDYDLAKDELVFKDRDSARQREIKTGDSWTPRIIAGLIIIAWVSITWFLVNHSIVKPGQVGTALDSNMEPMLMRTLGTLDMALGLVLGYYFGSSSSSDRKTEMLHQTQPAFSADIKKEVS